MVQQGPARPAMDPARGGGAGDAPPPAQPVVSLRRVSKTFGDRKVLDAVDLDVWPGQVHGLLGQNGSGKSTLIKVLAGYHPPDSGAELRVRGAEVALPLNPARARELGLSFVHQTLGLVDGLSVLENLRVGRFETRPGWRISWRHERARAREALARFDLEVDPDARVETLAEVDRAIVAIARALLQTEHEANGLLVFDEPTEYLPGDSRERFFAAVRNAASGGFGVVLVTHRLDEARAICDRLTVLRDGVRVSTGDSASITDAGLVEMILGRPADNFYPPDPPAARDRSRFALRNFRTAGVRTLSLDLCAGEIVGLTGLLGAGFDHVPYALLGRVDAAGEITVDGESSPLERFTAREAMRRGVAVLPANRLRYAGFGEASVRENVSLPVLGRFFRAGWLRRREERRFVRRVMEDFSVVPPEPDMKLALLSGGNQQKALIAKLFETDPGVIVLHEPTQGVDIGARHQIFQRLRAAAEQGRSIVMVSTEYEDLAHLCHRVLVFRHGAVGAEISGADLTAGRIVEASFTEANGG